MGKGLRVLGVASFVGATGLPVVPAIGPVQAATSGFSLPIDQSWFNGNYGGGVGPMDYGVCHHGACNNPGQRFWAIDLFAGSTAGQNIYAWESGTIQESAYGSGWGNYLKFGWNFNYGGANSTFVSLYAHGDSLAAGTGVGQYVTAGQLVMKMGRTGSGAGPSVHLHFDHRVLAAGSVFGNEALTTGTYTSYCTRMFLQRINSNQSVIRTGGFYRPPNTITNGTCT